MKPKHRKHRQARSVQHRRPGTKPAKAARAAKPAVGARERFYVAGIGASAGGLEALEGFFRHMPPDAGAAFVLVPHLDPTHETLLTGLLQRSTRMTVRNITDRTRVHPNRVYVIPPNKDLSIEDGVLRLKEPTSVHGLRAPIDFFLRRLAQDQESHAIGIILSGMGSDGSLGLKAIKERMGLAMVQEPASAKYDGMPRSAIDSGRVDFVAPPEQLAAKLVSYVRHAATFPSEPPLLADKSLTALQKIYALLREHAGHDFSLYKRNTIYRRIERRMSVHNHKHIRQYVRYLEQNPDETKLLFKELLIGVTGFFRDPGAWDVLKGKAVPQLLKGRKRGDLLRVWVPGCSSGEEAYSAAIVLRECQDQLKLRSSFKVQIFATDIDAASIEVARQGYYPAAIEADVSPERLQQFFTKEETGYRIKKDIRQTILFAPQNIIMDPPFTKLDLICCRNLLIYFTPELQKRLLPLFHYTLNPGGILMLGSSETIGTFADRFSVVDSQWKIFSHKESGAALRTMVDLPAALLSRDHPRSRGGTGPPKEAEGSLAELAQLVILQHYAPAAVVVNTGGDILYISGRTGKYLEPSPGKANMNILAMAREGLRLELRSALGKAASDRKATILHNLRVRSNGSATHIDLTVRPLDEPPELRGLFLVVFDELEPPPRTAPLSKANKSAAAGYRIHLADLERELRRTREQLQTTIEEMETSQEELKSANEELQSTNEELQSTNEELTTSKEEMQSLNEELVTVNTELQAKVDELSHASDDMKNLLNSTEIGSLFLDRHLHIKRYTPPATRLINLIPTDVGRPIDHLVTNLKYDSLVKDVRAVLETLVFKEAQVQTTDGRWHVMRIMPYRTLDNVIDGIVITFNDISPLKQMEASLRESRERMRELLDDMPVMLAATDKDRTIVFWNRECERVTGWKSEEVVGNPDSTKLYYPNEAYRARLSADRDRMGQQFRNWEVQFTCKDGTVKTIAWSNIAAQCPIPTWAEWGVAWELKRDAIA